jgi:N,N'-diacetyllegionaminate synthase
MSNLVKPFIIAEVGNNHEGRFEIAKKLILKASQAGVDAIKFQTFNTEDYVNGKNKKRYNQLKKFQFSREQFYQLSKIAKYKNLKFISTPFDIKSAEFLNTIVDLFKISSGDLTYFDLIKKVISFNKNTIISTGCSTTKEIKNTFEFIKKNKFSMNKLSFLHCVSMYPAPISNVNLSTINYLKRKFNIKIGYSDHTIGYAIPILSVFYGAKIVEKHFTLDNNFSKFRDHKLSLNPEDMKNMVNILKNLNTIQGKKTKILSKDERVNIFHLRRSFYLRNNIDKGEILKQRDLKFVRPFDGNGITNIDAIINKKTKKKIKKNTLIKKNHLK